MAFSMELRKANRRPWEGRRLLVLPRVAPRKLTRRHDVAPSRDCPRASSALLRSMTFSYIPRRPMRGRRQQLLFLALIVGLGCATPRASSDGGAASPPEGIRSVAYDVILRGGTISEGSGRAPHVPDGGIRGDTGGGSGTRPGGVAPRGSGVRGPAGGAGCINM